MTNPRAMNSDASVADVVSARISDSLPPELVEKLEAAGINDADRKAIAQAVLDGQNSLQDGDPLRTIRQSEDGVYYIRVNCDGVHKWRVVDPNNGNDNTFDMTPVSFPVVVEASGG